MKRLITICVLATLCTLSANAQYTGTVRINNSSVRFREEDNSVRVKFDMRILGEGSSWSRGILLTPALVDGDPTDENTNIEAMPGVMFQGNNKYRSTERAIRMIGKYKRAEFPLPQTVVRATAATDTLLTYDYSIPFEEWMSGARLSVYEEIIDFRGNRQLLVLSLADKVEMPAEEPEVVEVIVEPQVQTEIIELEANLDVDFAVNRTVIRYDFSRNYDELTYLHEVLGALQNDPTVKIHAFSIVGTASIEGSYANNEKLARNRAMALKSYITEHFTLPVSADQITVSWVAEDWDGLVELVENSNIESKDEILRIIATVPVNGGREKRLMEISGGRPYRIMLRDMFPQLRTVKYHIAYSKTIVTDAQQ